MKTRNIYIAASGLIALALSLSGKPAQAQTFANGNFGGSGTPTLTSWVATHVSPGSLSCSDNESIGGLNNYANVHFNTGQTAAGSTLSQTFSTLVGTSYAVNYEFGNYSAAGVNGSSQTLTAYIDSTTEQSETIAGVADSVPYGTYTFTFVAPTTSTTIKFSDIDSSSISSSDAILEKVSVAPVPESSTLVGVGLAALLMLGLTARSRKQQMLAVSA
jgi:hypothetical protein